MNAPSPLTHTPAKTTKWLTQVGLSACLLTLGACVAPPNATGPEGPPETSDTAPTVQSEEISEGQLPNDLLGMFDLSQAACSPSSITRLTITQDQLDFYYGYADIDAVTFQDGGYDIDATLYHQEGQVEVRPEAVTYRIEPNRAESGEPPESIQFENPWTGEAEPSPMVRCAT